MVSFTAPSITTNKNKFNMVRIFTALHGMQTRSSDENSIGLSVTREL